LLLYHLILIPSFFESQADFASNLMWQAVVAAVAILLGVTKGTHVW
jgi:hypothetical protein